MGKMSGATILEITGWALVIGGLVASWFVARAAVNRVPVTVSQSGIVVRSIFAAVLFVITILIFSVFNPVGKSMAEKVFISIVVMFLEIIIFTSLFTAVRLFVRWWIGGGKR